MFIDNDNYNVASLIPSKLNSKWTKPIEVS